MSNSSSPPSSIGQRGLLGPPCTGDWTMLKSTESRETSVHLTQLPSQGEMMVDCDRRRPPCCSFHAISESSLGRAGPPPSQNNGVVMVNRFFDYCQYCVLTRFQHFRIVLTTSAVPIFKPPPTLLSNIYVICLRASAAPPKK